MIHAVVAKGAYSSVRTINIGIYFPQGDRGTSTSDDIKSWLIEPGCGWVHK